MMRSFLLRARLPGTANMVNLRQKIESSARNWNICAISIADALGLRGERQQIKTR